MRIHDVEQGSEAWFKLRAGIPTASEASKLVTSTGNKSKSITEYAYQLAADLYAGKPLDKWEGNQYTDRGHDLELTALTEYSRLKEATIDLVGFCSTDEGSFGCSPDGLIGTDGMVEAKCLISKNHVKNIVYFNVHHKADPTYIPQTQMQMLVCDRKWVDLVYYHPELPMLIARQEPINEIQDMLIKQITECIRIRDNALKLIKEIK